MRHLRTDPIRLVLGKQREQALAQLEEAKSNLANLDRELTELRRRRQEAAATVRSHHDRLWPNYSKRGRQPAPDGSERLPPAGHEATRLWGRRLRAACRTVLEAAARPLELIELHAMLHDRGQLVHSRHAVKALSDAMSYELELGRVRRIRRGVYQLLPGG